MLYHISIKIGKNWSFLFPLQLLRGLVTVALKIDCYAEHISDIKSMKNRNCINFHSLSHPVKIALIFLIAFQGLSGILVGPAMQQNRH